jgi:hypothetical protein
LFALAGSLGADLDRSALSDDVSNAFQNAGYHLLSSSTVTVVTSGSAWRVNNGGDTSPAVGVGSAYATFSISKTSASTLQVYGSSLWITSIGDDGHLSTLQVAFDASALTQAEMTPVKDFPNGQPASAYPDLFTWEQMMTAKSPPSPPKCVPSPQHWCVPSEETRAYRLFVQSA